mgnify:CR=1 FL=1
MDNYVDQTVRRNVFAKRIVKAENVDNVQAFLTEKPLQIDLAENNGITMNGGGYVILDFGKEMHGTARILTHGVDSGEAKVRIRFGESVSETCSDVGGAKNATNDHSTRDVVVTLNRFSDMQFCQTGFRFIRIDNLDAAKIRFRTIVAVSIMREDEPTGKFKCNDDAVNEIFDVASYTLRLNMQNYIWDGIKRDRLVWMGDLHPETKSIACLYGKHDLVKKSLGFIKEQYPVPNFINNMPVYSLWYIIALYDYCYETDEKEYLKSNLDYIEGIINQFNGLIDEDGTYRFDFFFDWPTREKPDQEEGITSILYMAVEKASKTFEYFGKTLSCADELLEKISKKNKTVTWAKQSAAFLVYSGLVKPEEMAEFLVKDGAKGFSTFMSYYILAAIAMSGNYKGALDCMKEYYGGMLKMGATSFWEDFDLEWMNNAAPIDDLVPEGKSDVHGDNGAFCYEGFRHSLCHGWSCGPVHYLLHHVAGFNALDFGAKKLLVCPHLDGLDFVEASFPTANGVVTMRAENKNGKIYAKISAPDNVELVVENCIRE